MSVRLKIKISITAEPNGLFSSGNMPTGSVVVLSSFLGWWGILKPQYIVYIRVDFLLPLRAKPQRLGAKPLVRNIKRRILEEQYKLTVVDPITSLHDV